MGYLLRLIILLILAWLAYRLVRRLIGTNGNAAPKTGQVKIEMVRCHQCGVHVPVHEALMHDGKAYCSTAHLADDRK